VKGRGRRLRKDLNPRVPLQAALHPLVGLPHPAVEAVAAAEAAAEEEGAAEAVAAAPAKRRRSQKKRRTKKKIKRKKRRKKKSATARTRATPQLATVPGAVPVRSKNLDPPSGNWTQRQRNSGTHQNVWLKVTHGRRGCLRRWGTLPVRLRHSQGAGARRILA